MLGGDLGGDLGENAGELLDCVCYGHVLALASTKLVHGLADILRKLAQVFQAASREIALCSSCYALRPLHQ